MNKIDDFKCCLGSPRHIVDYQIVEPKLTNRDFRIELEFYSCGERNDRRDLQHGGAAWGSPDWSNEEDGRVDPTKLRKYRMGLIAPFFIECGCK